MRDTMEMDAKEDETTLDRGIEIVRKSSDACDAGRSRHRGRMMSRRRTDRLFRFDGLMIFTIASQVG